ncbi:2-oxo acid dehydrogenase subunit E2, partial [Actinomadura geliboluensis]|uniref:2-oxo acid dehydrogenase subunit E2 n=1 Tax=Actinomadura geliboluensis TaxID=882440 RepID=UPI00197AC963
RLPHVHLGFAAQTERGLVVPVVRDAHLLSLADLAAALRWTTASAARSSWTAGCGAARPAAPARSGC